MSANDLILPREAAQTAKPWTPGKLGAAAGRESDRWSASDPNGTPESEHSALRNRALREGFEQGYATGERAAREEAERLADLVVSTQQALAQLEASLSERLLDLAIDIARQVVRSELTAHREALLSVVQEAIRSVPDGTLNSEVVLHPSDVELVRTRLHEELKIGLWRVVPNAELEPGSVRITTRQCDVDATLATRWLRVMQSLGRSDAWKQPQHEIAGDPRGST